MDAQIQALEQKMVESFENLRPMLVSLHEDHLGQQSCAALEQKLVESVENLRPMLVSLHEDDPLGLQSCAAGFEALEQKLASSVYALQQSTTRLDRSTLSRDYYSMELSEAPQTPMKDRSSRQRFPSRGGLPTVALGKERAGLTQEQKQHSVMGACLR